MQHTSRPANTTTTATTNNITRQKADASVTDNFEIFVNDKLVHSKQTLNEGFLDDAHKCESLFKAIEEAGGTRQARRRRPALCGPV